VSGTSEAGKNLYENVKFTKKTLNLKEKMVVVGVITERRIRMSLRFRISAFFTIIGIFVSIAMWYFMAIFLQPGIENFISQYGEGNYFAYALIGIAFSAYAGISLSIYLSVIRNTYWANLLEMILSSPMRFSTFLASTLIWSFLVATVNILLYIILGVFVFQAPLPFPQHLGLFCLVLVLAILAISGFGLVSASTFLLWDVKGSVEPVSWVVTTIAGLVSGTMFPPEIFLIYFPPLYYLAKAIPHTYALDALRRIWLNGDTLATPIIQQEMLILCVFCVILLPLGVGMFLYGIKRAERTGKLARWG